MSKALVIFAEDDREDWMLIEEALVECGSPWIVEKVENGELLLKRLRDRTQELPSLIFLDIMMPVMNGNEALQEIKKDSSLKHIPVVIMTTSKMDSEIFKSYYDGANAYVVKPTTFEEMGTIMAEMKKFWGGTAKIPRIQQK